MLVISAEIGERVFIRGIPMKVVDVRGTTVRLGFDGDRESLPIEREKARAKRLEAEKT